MACDFAAFLQSLTKLDALDRVTQDLDDELNDSKKVMAEIQSMFDIMPAMAMERNNGVPQQELSEFLKAGSPEVLMEDMERKTSNLNIDEVINSMRFYAEELRSRILVDTQMRSSIPQDVDNLDIEQYASSLDHLGKRLSNVNISRTSVVNRDTILDAKLSQLCIDVDTFTQMVHAKSLQSEQMRGNSPDGVLNNEDALYYDNIINKLVAGVNEVSYLLHDNKSPSTPSLME